MGIGIFEEQEMNLYGAGQRQTRQIIRKKDTKTYPKRPIQPCNKTHRRHIAKRRDERMYRRICFHQPLYLLGRRRWHLFTIGLRVGSSLRRTSGIHPLLMLLLRLCIRKCIFGLMLLQTFVLCFLSSGDFRCQCNLRGLTVKDDFGLFEVAASVC